MFPAFESLSSITGWSPCEAASEFSKVWQSCFPRLTSLRWFVTRRFCRQLSIGFEFVVRFCRDFHAPHGGIVTIFPYFLLQHDNLTSVATILSSLRMQR